MKDMLGTEILVGDYVVYGVRVSNHGETKVGKVLDTTTKKNEVKVRGITAYYGKPEVQRASYVPSDKLVVCAEFPKHIRDMLDG